MNELAVLGAAALGGVASYVAAPAAETLSPASRRPALAAGATVGLVVAVGLWSERPALASMFGGAAIGLAYVAAKTPAPVGPVAVLTIKVAGQPDVQVLQSGSGVAIAPGQGFAIGEPRPVK